MTVLDRHLEFVETLREAGLPVSVSEGLDAVRAVGTVGLGDREALRVAYAATLVKRPSHRAGFDAIFDLFFPPRVGPGARWTEADLAGRDAPEAVTDLRGRITTALAGGDPEQAALGELAVELVERLGALPGRGKGRATWSAYQALSRVGAQALLDRLVAALAAEREPDEARRLAERRVASFSGLVDGEVRRRLAEDRTPQYVAETVLRPPVDQIAFTAARRADVEQMRREIYPLARRLAARLAKERHARRRGPLDFRRTVRASMSTGGVPLTTYHRPKRPHRTELVVLCDVSGSVAQFAQFTLLLVFALREEFTKVRAFTFVDDVHEVTRYFRPGGDPSETMAQLAASVAHASRWGRTDYGRAFTKFQERHADALGPKASLLVLGDARSNYGDLAVPAFTDMVRQARHSYWLNPEHRRQWGTGDSGARRYAEVVPMVECRNLSQLSDFVHDIV